jgi:hypothetical protein
MIQQKMTQKTVNSGGQHPYLSPKVQLFFISSTRLQFAQDEQVSPLKPR